MARMDIPFSILVNIPLVLLNLGIGVSNIVHGHPKLTIINFSAAGIIAGMAIGTLKLHQREMQIREEILDLQRRAVMPISPEAARQAAENLQKVCKALNATISHAFVQTEVKGQIFRLTSSGIYKINGMGQQVQETCYQIAGMPAEEKIASALLLLHNDPTVFDRWCRQDGYYV